MRGKVKCFFPERGFGFIRCENGIEVFVHHRQVWGKRRGLEEGESVEFDLTRDARSVIACNVRIIDPCKLPMDRHSASISGPHGFTQHRSTNLHASDAPAQTHHQKTRRGPRLMQIVHGFRAMMPRWLAKALL